MTSQVMSRSKVRSCQGVCLFGLAKLGKQISMLSASKANTSALNKIYLTTTLPPSLTFIHINTSAL